MNEIARPEASPFDAIRREDADGEYWTGRDLMPVMGYGADWRNFADAVNRAKAACKNSGEPVTRHFGDVTENSTGGRPRSDYRLTRYGAYLVAMNGDPRKQEIAAAQTYFAVKTREAETQPHRQLSRRDLAQMVIQEADRADAAEARVAELEPSASAWEELASAKGDDLAVADAAKILCRDPSIKIGRDRLFTVLRELGWAYRQQIDGRHRAYQRAIDAGRLSELPSSHYHPRTGELVLDPPRVRVTIKGLQELHRHLGGTAQLRLDLGGVA